MLPTRRITTSGGDKFRDEFSLAFDGTNDFVNFGSSSDLDVGTSEFSVSVWFKTATVGDSYGIVSKGDGLSGAPFDNHGWALSMFDDNDKLYFDIHAGTNGGSPEDIRIGLTSASTLVVNKWYHCVITRTTSGANSIYSIYLDGKLDAQATATDGGDNDALAADGTITDAGNNFNIGRWSLGEANYFEGNISDVAYYKTGLSASQVATIYNGREPYNHKEGVASGSLKAWYRMGDSDLDRGRYAGLGAGQDDLQVIANEVTPTLVSSSWWDTDASQFAGGSSTYAWTAYADSTISNDSNSLKIVKDDASSNTNGAYVFLRNASDLAYDLTVGRVYKIIFQAKVDTGDSVVVKINTDGGSNSVTWTVTSTSFKTHEGYFMAGSVAGAKLLTESMATGEIIWLDYLRIYQVGADAGVMQNMEITDFEGDTP